MKEITQRGGKLDMADLLFRVERLELEAREYEARCRIILGRANLERLRAEKASATGAAAAR